MTTPAHQFAERSSQSLARGDGESALQHARHGLAMCGEIPGLIWEECEALRALGRIGERMLRLNRLAALQPRDPVVLVELGLALLNTPSAPQAIKPLRAAVALGYKNVGVELALAGLEMGGPDSAQCEARLRAILADDPEHFGAQGMLWRLLSQQCRWAEAALLERNLSKRIAEGEASPALQPFWLLGSDLDEALLHRYALNHKQLVEGDVTHKQGTVFAETQQRPANEPLRIGYLSSDFYHHATAMLIAGLLESHSSSVEVFAYSYGPRVEDDYRTRLRQAVPNWRDINAMSDDAAAQQIRADGIDVLVELKGRTYGARLGITARKPAPVIVHYLGYPGTLAADGIDYLVADPILVPSESESRYAESVLRMPLCYQANDTRRVRPAPTPRAELGLPDDAIVLCNFNQSYKWSERFMRVWMRALQRAPKAVLWLLEPDTVARANVMTMAKEHNVVAQIHWAPRAKMEAHLARLGAANLALDQLPCASHTTGSDALWVGVPLLTCIGDTYQGRVGASLVNAAGLIDLIVPNIEAYERMLGNLLAQPDRLLSLQADYAARAATAPLFDTATFTAAWEALLRTTYDARASARAQSDSMGSTF